MKKMMTLMFILIMSMLVMLGCSSFSPLQAKEDNPNDIPSGQQEETAPNGSGDDVPKIEDDVDTERQESNNSAQENSDEVKNDVQTDSGRFSGRADSNFIEIKLSGVPEEMSYRTFMLSEELKEDFDRLNLQLDEVVKFKYTVNEHDQGVIFEISRI